MTWFLIRALGYQTAGCLTNEPVERLVVLAPARLRQFHFLRPAMAEAFEEDGAIEFTCRDVTQRSGEIGITFRFHTHRQLAQRRLRSLWSQPFFQPAFEVANRDGCKGGRLQTVAREINQ